jgi:hypothetical protein
VLVCTEIVREATASWITLNDKTKNAFQRYMAVGEVLAEGGNECLVDALNEIGQANTSPQPFVVLDGPSGVGKSQQFFALPNHRVVYLPIASWAREPHRGQPIYSAFRTLSGLFRSAVHTDVTGGIAASALKEQVTKEGARIDVFEQESFNDLLSHRPSPLLWTAGVVMMILKAFQTASSQEVLCRQVGLNAERTPHSETFRFTPCTFPTVHDWVTTNRAKLDNFVFVIDELPGSRGLGHQNIDLQLNTFARGIFRALGIPLVLAGTDSTLINAMGDSASRGEPVLWCITIAMVGAPTLPAICAALGRDSLTKANVSDMAVPGLLELALNSRPWLAVMLLEIAFDMKSYGTDFNLDDLVDACAVRVYQQKEALQVSLGQWRSFESSSKFMSDLNDTACSDLVVSHLAYLHLVSDAEPPTAFRMARFFPRNAKLVASAIGAVDSAADTPKEHPLVMERPDNQQIRGAWHASCAFPCVADEPLLHLVLHNTASTFAFASHKGHRVSAITARVRTLRGPLGLARRTHDGNPDARSRSGDVLEAIVAVAWCLASHGNGLQGVTLDEFLNSLLSELTLSDAFFRVTVNPVLSHFVDDVDQIRVPYLFAPEPGGVVDIPPWLCAPGRLLGYVVRTRNQAEIDVESGLLPLSTVSADGVPMTITGECKNHRAELDIELLKECISRIPRRSKLHLLFCDKLSEGLLLRTKDIKFDVGRPEAVKKNVEVLRSRRQDDAGVTLAYPSDSFGKAWNEARRGGVKPDFVVVIVALTDLLHSCDPESAQQLNLVLAGQ